MYSIVLLLAKQTRKLEMDPVWPSEIKKIKSFMRLACCFCLYVLRLREYFDVCKYA